MTIDSAALSTGAAIFALALAAGGARPVHARGATASDSSRYDAHALSLGKTSFSFTWRGATAGVAAGARGPAAPAP